MNDDFLRRTWRRPPAAFEQQLRERLRQQELAPAPRRRPTWGMLIVAALVGGSALATATYLTTKHFSQQSASTTEMASSTAVQTGRAPSGAAVFHPSQSRVGTRPTDRSRSSSMPHEEQADSLLAARETGPSSPASSPTGTSASGYTSLASGPSSSPAPVRMAVTPTLAAISEDTAGRFWGVPRIEVASADVALPALCADPSPTLDVVIATRRIERRDLEACKKPGMLEAKLGHIATVISGAKAGSPMQLSADTILRALLKRVPSRTEPGQLIDNPYTDWSQISRSTEPRRIDVLGPPSDSQHFLVFAATILEPACDQYPWIRALRANDRTAYEEICHTLREDGVYKTAPYDNTFVGQRLWADPNLVAVLDYAFYAANSDDLIGSLLKGPAPTSSSVRDGSYPGARAIYLFVSDARSRVVNIFLDDYLRRNDLARFKWIVPVESNNSRRYFQPLPLTEVKPE